MKIIDLVILLFVLIVLLINIYIYRRFINKNGCKNCLYKNNCSKVYK